jgi:hypothetical protein
VADLYNPSLLPPKLEPETIIMGMIREILIRRLTFKGNLTLSVLQLQILALRDDGECISPPFIVARILLRRWLKKRIRGWSDIDFLLADRGPQPVQDEGRPTFGIPRSIGQYRHPQAIL